MIPPFSSFENKLYYSYQEEVIARVRESRKKVIFIDGPPGTGKSLIGMSIAYDYLRSIYLCTSKPLQQQLLNDFPEPEAVMLQGRSNYPCVMSKFTESQFSKISCEDCVEGDEEDKDKVSCKPRCLYQLQKKKALRSHISILNTAYYLTEVNYVGRFKEANLVVVDECDQLEGAIEGFVELNISDRMLSRLKLRPPQYKTKWESWKEWAQGIFPKLTQEIERGKVVTNAKSDINEIRYFRKLKSLSSKISIFKDLLDDTWIYQEFTPADGNNRYSFKPTWISTLAHRYFWDHADKFICMSGTPPIPKTLGLEQSEWDWIEVPSQFPPERRPVYYLGISNLTQKTIQEERPKIIPVIKDILLKHKEEKGLIHTVSYSLTKYVLDNVNSDRLVSHNSGGRERERLLELFKSNGSPLVLVSPSMERGIDFQYEQCRFIIICKVPFPDLGDKQTAKRLYSSSFGQFWYRMEAVRSIIQSSMRGVRAVDDSCSCYILDSNFENLYAKMSGAFPNWWKEALRIV